MSKYYKAEDVIRCVAQYIMTDAKIDNSYVCGDIEDYIEFTEAILADLPTIEVGEDCISREWLLNLYEELAYLYKDVETDSNKILAGIIKNIKKAPSVVPRLDKEDLEDIKEHIAESYIEGYMDGQAPSIAEGEWINKQEKYQMAECSNCKKVTMHEMWGDKLVYYDYCPNCGAKMKV